MPHVASPDEVRITRDSDSAIIEYADPSIPVTHFKIGPELARMTDEEVLERWNECREAVEEHRRDFEYVAVEVPVGRPQVRYFSRADQWVPRGGVLRCLIDHDLEHGAIVHIDDREFTPLEFATMLGTYGGWGMRIAFVPDDEVHETPRIEVREPEDADE